MKVIAITGKGGTGKTAVAAMLVQLAKKESLVLAIDADPDTNLPTTLGDKVEHTVGQMRELMFEQKDNLPSDINKESILEGRIYNALLEKSGYDLLVMGRPDGLGCYCYANNLLRGIMDRIIKNYEVVIVDTAAGLEHFSRGIIRDVTDLLIVTDASKNGFETAQRIRDLIVELNLNIKHVWIVPNKVTEKNRKRIEEYIKELNITPAGIIPFDETLAQLNLEGKPLTDLPDDSPSAIQITDIARKIELVRA